MSSSWAGRTSGFLGLAGGRRRVRRRRPTHGLESLETRDLLSVVSQNALPPTLGSRLVDLTVIRSPGPYVVGQPIRLTVIAVPGSMGLPTELESVTIQVKQGNGRWVDAGTSAPQDGIVQVVPSSRGRLQYRAVATVLVDADAANEPANEDDPGFDDVIDLTGLRPRAAYRKVISIVNSGADEGDTQLAFLSPVIGVQVALAAKPAPEPPAKASDALFVMANGVSDGGPTSVPNPRIYIDTGAVKNGMPVLKYLDRTDTAFEGSLMEGPNDTDTPSNVLTTTGIFSEVPPEFQRTIEIPKGTSTTTRAVILTEPNDPKAVSDVIVLTINLNTSKTPKPDGTPYHFYDFSFVFTSDAGGKPLNVFVPPPPVPGKNAPPAPAGAIVVPSGTQSIPETGKYQDITALLFPEYYKRDKNKDLVKNAKGEYTLATTSRLPPLIVKAFSDVDPS